MKKILVLVSAAMLSASVFAGPVQFLAGSTAGSVTKVSKGGTGGVACDALTTASNDTPVKVGLSKENVGSMDCSSVDIGVAVSSPKGKGNVYATGTGGGSLQESKCASISACATSDTDTAATTALTKASS